MESTKPEKALRATRKQAVTLDFSQMNPHEVVTLLRVAWGDSDTDYYPEPKEPPGWFEHPVLAHLDTIAATDHDQAKATLDAFAGSPLAVDRINTFSLLVGFTPHARDVAMPYWERLICDANDEVGDWYESFLDRYLYDHPENESAIIVGVGLVPADVRYLLQLREQALAEGTLVDLGKLAVDKLMAAQPEAKAVPDRPLPQA